MRPCRLSLTILCAALAAPLAPGAAASTLKQAFESAWQRAPAARTLEARQDETAAARDNATSWLASNPTLGLSHRADQGASRRDERELEVSLSSSFWRPGQKRARQALAASSSAEVAAHLGATRLAVAALVRTRVWEAAAAQVNLEEKQDHLKHLEGLADEVARRVKAGDLARTDGLLAMQEVLAVRIAVLNAHTGASEALVRYRAVTGLATLPPLEPEALANSGARTNVRLLAATASEQRARAALRLAVNNRTPAPGIALSMRRNDENPLREPVNSVGVSLQIPLASAFLNRGAESAALTSIATAAAETAAMQAEADADLEIAQQKLANARATLDTAAARAAALHEHTELFEKAFRAGERGLGDLLRSRALTHEADVAVAQQKVALGLAHAQHNQALGILP